MRQITNSIKCLIVFGIWLLGFNTLSACNIKLKIVYTQADLRTIFDITPELFDKGLISHSLDSIIVVSDMKFSKFFDTINWLSGNLVGISINLCKSIQKELFINDTP